MVVFSFSLRAILSWSQSVYVEHDRLCKGYCDYKQGIFMVASTVNYLRSVFSYTCSVTPH